MEFLGFGLAFGLGSVLARVFLLSSLYSHSRAHEVPVQRGQNILALQFEDGNWRCSFQKLHFFLNSSVR
jgi:hypothetical protein